MIQDRASRGNPDHAAGLLSGLAAQWGQRGPLPRSHGANLGGRPPYGYRLADAGPHPNKEHAAWGRRAHRLEPDPVTAPVVRWIFAQRQVGLSLARITAPSTTPGSLPSAADPRRNPHRSGACVEAEHRGSDPGQPRYTGRQGVEPAAHRSGPGRPGEYRAGAPEGAAVEPARGLGHLAAVVLGHMADAAVDGHRASRARIAYVG